MQEKLNITKCNHAVTNYTSCYYNKQTNKQTEELLFSFYEIVSQVFS